MSETTCFFSAVRRALRAKNVDEKLRLTRALAMQMKAGQCAFDSFGIPVAVDAKGVPDQPRLVQAKAVPKRGFGSREGRSIMMHAIAHIEFNAINLALDAAQRFADMPQDFYTDWLRIADEEAYHFELIRTHLRFLGAEYGDFPAHEGLWEMAEKTAHDVLQRMALVPRVLEARGLDVTPGIQEKLRQAGDAHAATLLDIIFADEIGHVAIGTHWFHYLCDQRQCDPDQTFLALIQEYFPRGMYGPYNVEARISAGFSDSEMQRLLEKES